MDKNLKDIPIELDMKIIEYASKKNFKSHEHVYRFILRCAALFAVALTVFCYVCMGRSTSESADMQELAYNEYEQFYLELTTNPDDIEASYTDLDENLDDELQNQFAISFIDMN